MSADRLATVLRLRRLEEHRARLALARALGDHDAARRRLAVARAEQAAATAGLRSLLEGRVPIAEVAARTAAVEVGERNRAVAEAKVEAAQRVVAEAREALATAIRRRNAVERLRQRRLAERRLAVERRSERELTEIALVRHARAIAERMG